MAATRYMGKHGTHHGVISLGSLLTGCALIFIVESEGSKFARRDDGPR